MSTTRKPGVRREEQLKLINECRRSGLTDAEWYRQNGIASSAFYTWLSRNRKAAAEQIEPPSYGCTEIPKASPEVVETCIVPENYPETPAKDKHPSHARKSIFKNSTKNRRFQQAVEHDAG